MREKIRYYYRKIAEHKLSKHSEEYKWIFNYGKKHILAIVLYTLVGLSGTLVGLISGVASKDLVDIITGKNTGEVVKAFATIIVLSLISMLIGQLSGAIINIVTARVSNSIKADIYEKIMSSEWESLSAFHSGDISARWGGDSVTVAAGILTIIPNIIQSAFSFGSALYLVISYDPSFAIFALVGGPISILTTRKNLSRMRKVGMSSLGINTKMSSFTSEAFANFQFVKAFNLKDYYSRKLKELQNELFNVTIKQQKISILNAVIFSLTSSAITYTTYGWGIYKVWSGAITYGTMTLFLSLSNSLAGTMQSILGIFPSIIGLTNSAKRLITISELPKEDFSQVDEVKAFFEEHRTEGVGLTVNNTSYAYMNGTEVFNNIDFEAHPNEVVALVGPSGEGKTTMLRLLLALVRSQEGCGWLTSEGNASMPLTASCRQLISYVPQGNTMFSGTIAENMRFVKEDATDEEIIEALKLACAWSFVEKLPDGINSEIRERGLGFSEGQAQRLSIARALIRKSPILLLDEATSALDVYTEKELLNNILNDDYPRTTIVTAHRLTVLRACNRVYKIHDKTCTLMSDEEVQELMNM